MSERKTAIIIGAGPAGLTAALELLDTTDIIPTIFEQTADIGGISKTTEYKNYRFDMGGHRFFTKSEEVNRWWGKIMPLEEPKYPNLDRVNTEPLLDQGKDSFLLRQRVSRIFFKQNFYDYPISASISTLKKIGLKNSIRIVIGYLNARIRPILPEKSLEDFYINTFGKMLYQLFFEKYTEKLWGTHPKNISPDWGRQRTKGLSLSKTLFNAIKSTFIKDKTLSQENTETSLIQQFIYPKYGPGQFWEKVASTIINRGGKIYMNSKVTGLYRKDKCISKVKVKNTITNEEFEAQADYFISSMPVNEVISDMVPEAPQGIVQISGGLEYRDFISVDLIFRNLKIKNETKIKTLNNTIPDNWIYLQDPEIKACRIQIFNNWSPFMVPDQSTVSVGVEYVCSKNDAIWSMDRDMLVSFALEELVKIGVVEKSDFIDGTVEKIEKAYPAYFGSYLEFPKIREYLDGIDNLYCIGRNGMHRYNNMDHSMLSAMEAVRMIKSGGTDKNQLWGINVDDKYQETKEK